MHVTSLPEFLGILYDERGDVKTQTDSYKNDTAERVNSSVFKVKCRHGTEYYCVGFPAPFPRIFACIDSTAFPKSGSGANFAMATCQSPTPM